MRGRAGRKLLMVVAAALVSLFAWRAVRDAGAPARAVEDDELVDNRVWVEKRPDKHTDYVHVMLLFTRSHVAIWERASSYDIRLELAEFQRDKSAIKMVFPQSGQKKDFTFKVTKCDALPPFDLCLDVSDNPWGGPKRYYGFTNPEEERQALGVLADDARARAEAASATE